MLIGEVGTVQNEHFFYVERGTLQLLATVCTVAT